MQSISNLFNGQKVLDERYILQDQLGSGLTSKVFKVKDIKTGETKAAKIFENNMSVEFQKEMRNINLINEINVATNIKCFAIDIGFLTYNGKKEQKMYEILEYGDHGTLFEKVESSINGLSEDVCRYIFYKILLAIKALHSHGICHRDIKPENMLFVGIDYDLKLCDYGFLVKFLNKENKKRKLKKPVGTTYYCAPEILERKDYDGEKSDIFSLGATLFVLMTKKFAFEEAKVNNISSKVSKTLYKLIKTKQYGKYWETMENYFKVKQLSEQFKNLFVKMVAYNPEERPSIEEIMKEDFMKDIANANEERLAQLKHKMVSELNFRESA